MKTADGVPATIYEYIATFPPEIQDILKQVRATIKKAAPGAEETIKYRIPTFVLNENLVHFAALKNHIGFYPTPSGIEEFKHELAEYKLAKGSVQFPIDKPMPLRLIEKIVKFRVNEVKGKSVVKKGKK
ncbi:MAG: iron chaperone [Desulfobulbaceae bacterium]